jgi:hypothetical protein
MFFKQILFYFVSLIFFASSLSADITSLKRVADKEGWDALYFRASRMSSILNNQHAENYFWSKGYPSFGESFLKHSADITFDRDNLVNPILTVTIHLDYVRNGVQEREFFAFKFNEFILKLCREFICEDLSEKDLRLVVKYGRIKEIENNTLFIWDKRGPIYFPRFFDENFHLETDKEENSWYGNRPYLG